MELTEYDNFTFKRVWHTTGITLYANDIMGVVYIDLSNYNFNTHGTWTTIANIPSEYTSSIAVDRTGDAPSKLMFDIYGTSVRYFNLTNGNLTQNARCVIIYPRI